MQTTWSLKDCCKVHEWMGSVVIRIQLILWSSFSGSMFPAMVKSTGWGGGGGGEGVWMCVGGGWLKMEFSTAVLLQTSTSPGNTNVECTPGSKSENGIICKCTETVWHMAGNQRTMKPWKTPIVPGELWEKFIWHIWAQPYQQLVCKCSGISPPIRTHKTMGTSWPKYNSDWRLPQCV